MYPVEVKTFHGGSLTNCSLGVEAKRGRKFAVGRNARLGGDRFA